MGREFLSPGQDPGFEVSVKLSLAQWCSGSVWRGLSYREICECTGRTHTWVNRHITEGRQALRYLIDHGEP
jgi:hypothetical protein